MIGNIVIAGVSLVFFCFLLKCMTKSNKEQSKNNSNRNLKIDGLRGVLAVSVFFHHTVISYYWIKNGTWEPIDNIAIMNLGSVSVSLFL